MSRHDISTGDVDLSRNQDYSSKGPNDVRSVSSERPAPISNVCTIYGAPVTCTEEQLLALADGTAEVENWVVVKPDGLKVGGGGGGRGDVPSMGHKIGVGLLSLVSIFFVLC